MPRKIPEITKAHWLEQFEKGKSEKQIANDSKCDLRTVRKAIHDARQRDEAKFAHAGLVRDALRSHQDFLIGDLSRIISSFDLPDAEQPVISWHGWEDSTSLRIETAKHTWEKAHVVVPDPLLRQHLKNDRLWKLVAHWKKAAEVYQEAAIALQIKTAEILGKKTGLRLSTRIRRPSICTYTAAESVYRTAVQRALGMKDEPSFESCIVADKQSGEVISGSQIFAKASGREEAVREGIIAALNVLISTAEMQRMIETFEALKEKWESARQTAKHLKMLGMIPGLCEICELLGLR